MVSVHTHPLSTKFYFTLTHAFYSLYTFYNQKPRVPTSPCNNPFCFIFRIIIALSKTYVHKLQLPCSRTKKKIINRANPLSHVWIRRILGIISCVDKGKTQRPEKRGPAGSTPHPNPPP